ncbi:alkaline phosphatase family protein [Catenulispora sp. NL8]|uniref:Alkaline phosphatase family protein n=1 Tax=Catenulispora pinistramenti TaxID=2705254 RepID=A0ABS5KWL5_9ACTN|nr:nucleotide pyrophosphatase/phosphodiesterase family protein [Catenulispora pinistramenti]MBS2550419.1 alkaline phosphatase family protein [Catenulispora pinistramenti]
MNPPGGSGPDRSDLVLPAYGRGALSDLLPAVLAALGVPGAPNPLGLAPTRRACVFLVDGMGARLIERNAELAPYLAKALRANRDLTAGFPSTTAASIGSLGTGLPSGASGMLGYRVLVPGTSRMINLLRWDVPVDPLEWQPHETVFERAEREGIEVTQVTAARFQDSGLTRSVLRGGAFTGAESLPNRVAGALETLKDAADRDARALVYLYYADLDAAGHLNGVDSESWRGQLAVVDATVRELVDRLPAGTTLYVTADHGMVDVPADRRVDVDEDPELQVGVRLLGGEGRARHVYAKPGAARDVLQIWREALEDVAVVRSRDEAIYEGWFGPPEAVDERLAPRIGDVVAALLADWAVVATRREKLESRLLGMHGSLSAAEQEIPLLVFGAGAVASG